MKLKIDDLGVVGITVDDWSFEKSFKPKTIVTDYLNWKTYISRRAVPKHIELENTYYWKPILKPYGDVKNVQSDWDQDDETQPDYIKNKPNVEIGGDKPYDPEHFSGLGKKTLELGEDGSNILTQEEFDQENTIYVIQYDFDLNGETIDVPEGCVLDFEGGSVSNGKLVSNSSIIYGTIDKSKDNLVGLFYDNNGKPLNYDFTVNGGYKLPVKYGTFYGSFPEELGLSSSYSIGSPQGIASDSNYFYCFHDAIKNNVKYVSIVLYDRNFNKVGYTVIEDVPNGHPNDVTIYNNKIYVALTDTNGCMVLNKNDVITHCLNSTNIQTSQVIKSDLSFVCIDYDNYTNTFCVIGNQQGIYDTDFNKIKSLPNLQVMLEGSLNQEYPHVEIQSIMYRRGVLYSFAWLMTYGASGAVSPQVIISAIDISKGSVVFNQIFPSDSFYSEAEGFCWDEVYNCPICSVYNVDGFDIRILAQNISISLPASINSLSPSSNRYTEVYVDNTYTGFSNGSPNYPYKTLAEAWYLTSGSAGTMHIYLKVTSKPYYFNTGIKRISSTAVRGWGEGKAKLQILSDILYSKITFERIEISRIRSNSLAIRIQYGDLVLTDCVLNTNSTSSLIDVADSNLAIVGNNIIQSENSATVSIAEAYLAFNLYLSNIKIGGTVNCINSLLFRTATTNNFVFNTALHNILANSSNYYFMNNVGITPIEVYPVDSATFGNTFYKTLPQKVNSKGVCVYVFSSSTGSDNAYTSPQKYIADANRWRCLEDERRYDAAPVVIGSLSAFKSYVSENPNAYIQYTPVYILGYGVVYCNCTVIRTSDGRTAVPHNGTTEQRLAIDELNDTFDLGLMFFDTTLQKPVYWSGSTNGWVDALGEKVDTTQNP